MCCPIRYSEEVKSLRGIFLEIEIYLATLVVGEHTLVAVKIPSPIGQFPNKLTDILASALLIGIEDEGFGLGIVGTETEDTRIVEKTVKACVRAIWHH